MLIARSQLAHSSRQCDPRCMFVGITQCDSEVMGLNLDVMPVVCIYCEFLLRGCLHVSDLGMMKCYNFWSCTVVWTLGIQIRRSS